MHDFLSTAHQEYLAVQARVEVLTVPVARAPYHLQVVPGHVYYSDPYAVLLVKLPRRILLASLGLVAEERRDELERQHVYPLLHYEARRKHAVQTTRKHGKRESH